MNLNKIIIENFSTTLLPIIIIIQVTNIYIFDKIIIARVTEK